MAKELETALKGMTVKDVRVDRLGRIVIINPEVSSKIKELTSITPDLEELVAGNGICCGNGACLSEQLVAMLDRVVGGRRPGGGA